MKKFNLLMLIVFVSGCSSLPSFEEIFATTLDNSESSDVALSENSDGIVDVDQSAVNTTNLQQQSGQERDAFGSIVKPKIMSSATGAYKGRPLTKHVGDYVRNMTHELVSNMEYVTESTPVAVTHFALIDSNLNETNLLGQQMAESFVHEFHKFRMPVIEFKATQFIRVTETGDFTLSRDFMDLKNSTPIQYVLTGTLTKHQGGYLVNARVLGMASNVVVASSQSFIPYYVVDALLPSGASRQNEIIDGVRIISGE